MEFAENKVVLRTVERQDRGMLEELIQDPEIAKVTGGYPSPPSYDHQMDWFCAREGSACNLRYIIADKDTPQAGLGIILLSHVDWENKTAEIYIKLRKSARGKGYGEGAVNALVSFAFCQLRLKVICSHILEYNMPSRRLFEKCGFCLKEIHRSRAGQEGSCRNVYCYVLCSGDSCCRDVSGGD